MSFGAVTGGSSAKICLTRGPPRPTSHSIQLPIPRGQVISQLKLHFRQRVREVPVLREVRHRAVDEDPPGIPQLTNLDFHAGTKRLNRSLHSSRYFIAPPPPDQTHNRIVGMSVEA